MSSIQTQNQSSIQDSSFSNYVRKQSLRASESLDAGLTIKTKEGDLVTLSSSSYAQMDSYMYDSRGVLRTSSGTAAVSESTREITLASGESFSFSVKGDLSEKELEDIEAIVKGIDGIISEVAEGDMDDAVEKALSMGGYDSISMYSADISYQKTYAMRSEIQTRAEEAFAGPEDSKLQKKAQNAGFDVARMFEKAVEELEKHEARLFEKAEKPVNKLFEHYLEEEQDAAGEKSPEYAGIEDLMEKVSEQMEKMTRGLFKGTFSGLMG